MINKRYKMKLHGILKLYKNNKNAMLTVFPSYNKYCIDNTKKGENKLIQDMFIYKLFYKHKLNLLCMHADVHTCSRLF